MQKEDNLLDQYLKDKVEEASFDFKEEYWLKASQMLDEEDRKKKRPFFWRWVVVLGVLITAGIGTLIYSNKNNDSNKDSNKSDIAQNNTPPSQTPSAKSYVIDNPSAADMTLPAQQEVQNNPAKDINQGISENNTPAITKGHEAAGTKDGSPATKAHTQSDKENTPVENGQLPSRNNHTASALAVTPNQPAVKPGQKETRRNRRAKQAISQGQKMPEEKTALNNIAGTKANPDNAVLVNGKKMQPVDTQFYVQKHARDESVYNPRYNAALSNYITERLDSVTVLTYKKIPETKPETPLQAILKDTSARIKNALQFFLSGGANFNRGFKGNANTSIAWGVSPYLTAGIEKNITPKISLAAQIGFTYFNALNVQKKVIHYKYSFGYDSTQLSVEYHKLYQLMLPVSIAYQLNKSHSAWASIGAAYILNTSSKVTDNGNSSYQTGYQDGINPFDLFAQLGYQYRLNKRFNVQAFLQQGFCNVTQKDYFNITTRNTQTRISIGLKYYFKRNGN